MSGKVYRAIVLSTKSSWWAFTSPKSLSRYHTRPSKNEIGAFETIVGFSVLSFGLLSPAAWILANLPEQPKH
ncbi:hypothetical protein GDO81_015492 [Engystomops pustulosus]|uniref:Uncharacterized protein n=1 Tax=Engystomops pustulosus TaxID=76066 RepID=A0AAV7AJV2_ENGPU|nr:hypothetical protein GDO81_015492 [Engystomops pustulosus]